MNCRNNTVIRDEKTELLSQPYWRFDDKEFTLGKAPIHVKVNFKKAEGW